MTVDIPVMWYHKLRYISRIFYAKRVQPQYQLAIAHPSGTLTTDTFSSVNNTNG